MPRLILGHTTHNSAKIWVRGTSRWPVAFVDLYRPDGNQVGRTKTIILDGEDYYTGTVKWSRLASNQDYTVKVAFGKNRDATRTERVREAYTTGDFRTFPAPASRRSFSFLLGSCNLHSLGWLERPDKAWVRISEVATRDSASFMIHCGDQIYSDIPFPPNSDVSHFRNKYLDAWEDCRPAQRVLTELPHYMTLDDHEITNNYNRDKKGIGDGSLERAALKAYWEFQHKHNPDSRGDRWTYHFTFNYGAAQFFVLDTRTERSPNEGEMISESQLSALTRWLTRHSTKLKFIVSSVPFVTEVKRPKEDKWCDPAYADQRERILRHIVRNQIGKVIFLTGDMHTSYHATMTASEGTNHSTIHEIMSSPINQITPNTTIADSYKSPSPPHTTASGLTFQSEIDQRTFFGNHSNITSIEVDGDSISYKIYRTARRGNAARTGRFTV